LCSRFHETGARFGVETEARFTVHPADPASARCDIRHSFLNETEDGLCTVRSAASLSADADAYEAEGSVRVSWNGDDVANHDWAVRPRRRV
jgi:hypothetical protein